MCVCVCVCVCVWVCVGGWVHVCPQFTLKASITTGMIRPQVIVLNAFCCLSVYGPCYQCTI